MHQVVSKRIVIIENKNLHCIAH